MHSCLSNSHSNPHKVDIITFILHMRKAHGSKTLYNLTEYLSTLGKDQIQVCQNHTHTLSFCEISISVNGTSQVLSEEVKGISIMILLL